MNDELLAVYLNDHLAGSVVGVEVARHCRDDQGEGEIGAFLDALVTEIEQDRDALKEAIGRLGSTQDTAKKSAAWLAEKAARLKLGRSGDGIAELSLFEHLELLLLGVRGKLALWDALLTLGHPELAGIDLPRLKQRAEDQLDRIEVHRLAAARKAFAGRSEAGETARS